MSATTKPVKSDGASPSLDKASEEALKRIVVVGNPNVGKSVLFNCLTGIYATVSNYPGTTVEVTKGKVKFGVE